MSNTLYKYNAETCQYERIRVKTPDAVFYMSGVVVVAILMLAGMLVLHDYIFDSKKEIAFRNENKALEKNQVILASQLSTIESTLSQLSQEDEKLHAKFFGTPMEKPAVQNEGAKRELLLADVSIARNAIEEMNGRSAKLLRESEKTRSFFAEKLSFKKNQKNIIHSIPVSQPTHPWNSENLLSGFGMRVNPFHKGLYEHPGIDIALPRGSVVVATAAGTVIDIKRSDVQAGYGNYIEINHGNGFITRYAHLEEINVRYGQRISKGDIIALSGNSGGSIAPHLHYEIIRDGVTVDPVHYMIEGLTTNEHFKMQLLGRKQNQSLD